MPGTFHKRSFKILTANHSDEETENQKGWWGIAQAHTAAVGQSQDLNSVLSTSQFYAHPTASGFLKLEYRRGVLSEYHSYGSVRWQIKTNSDVYNVKTNFLCSQHTSLELLYNFKP